MARTLNIDVMKTNPTRDPVPAVALGRLSKRCGLLLLLLMACISETPRSWAFPPAPHHLVYGLVRDEFGNPLHIGGAVVYLEVDGGATVRAEVVPGQAPGVNYQLRIPIDAGITADLYKPTALRPTVPFRIRVRVGDVDYLPMEMSGASELLSKPGEATRLDLTLGVDSDGDGLPDAWKWAVIEAMGGGLTLADIRPDDDLDGDGLTNMQEYLAGTYAFDPEDGFSLDIQGVDNGRSLLEFTAIRGRSYTIHVSSDMVTWSQRSFHLKGEPESAPEKRFFSATQVRRLTVRMVPGEVESATPEFYRVKVQ